MRRRPTYQLFCSSIILHDSASPSDTRHTVQQDMLNSEGRSLSCVWEHKCREDVQPILRCARTTSFSLLLRRFQQHLGQVERSRSAVRANGVAENDFIHCQTYLPSCPPEKLLYSSVAVSRRATHASSKKLMKTLTAT